MCFVLRSLLFLDENCKSPRRIHCRFVFPAGTELRLSSQHVRIEVRQMFSAVQPTSVEVGPGVLRTVPVSRPFHRMPIRPDRGRREIQSGHLRDLFGRWHLHQLFGEYIGQYSFCRFRKMFNSFCRSNGKMRSAQAITDVNIFFFPFFHCDELLRRIQITSELK